MEVRQRKIYIVTLVGSLVNLLLLAFKFFAGVEGKSGAMLADAVHSSSDFITDFIVIGFVTFSSRPDDKGHPYGYGKYETIATTLVSLILFFVGVGILCDGCMKIWDTLRGTREPLPSTLALYAALISVVLKGGLYYWTLIVGKRVESNAVVANAWHHYSDALSSVGTGLGIAGAIFLGGKWAVLDPIAAVIVSVFILKTAISLLIPSISELTDRSLPPQKIEEIQTIVSSFCHLESIHHLRTRSIGRSLAIEMHVRVAPDTTVAVAHHITQQIETALKEKLGENTLITIHVEPFK